MTDSERGVPLYDAFGERYDLMVDWSGRLSRESPFFEAVFREAGARRVLDVGAGTGWHAAHFARLGPEVVGADPSGEMVRLARDHHAGAPNLRFVQAGLGELRSAVVGEFDVVTCVGNTLPHVPDQPALVRALADARQVLRAGGALVVQQLNYDRILKERRRFLGTTSRTSGGTEYLFFRFYDFHPDRLAFNLVTFSRAVGSSDWRFDVDSTSLLPITAAELQAALAATGFGEVRLQGDYEGARFDPAESGDLVVIARAI